MGNTMITILGKPLFFKLVQIITIEYNKLEDNVVMEKRVYVGMKFYYAELTGVVEYTVKEVHPDGGFTAISDLPNRKLSCLSEQHDELFSSSIEKELMNETGNEYSIHKNVAEMYRENILDEYKKEHGKSYYDMMKEIETQRIKVGDRFYNSAVSSINVFEVIEVFPNGGFKTCSIIDGQRALPFMDLKWNKEDENELLLDSSPNLSLNYDRILKVHEKLNKKREAETLDFDTSLLRDICNSPNSYTIKENNKPAISIIIGGDINHVAEMYVYNGDKYAIEEINGNVVRCEPLYKH